MDDLKVNLNTFEMKYDLQKLLNNDPFNGLEEIYYLNASLRNEKYATGECNIGIFTAVNAELTAFAHNMVKDVAKLEVVSIAMPINLFGTLYKDMKYDIEDSDPYLSAFFSHHGWGEADEELHLKNLAYMHLLNEHGGVEGLRNALIRLVRKELTYVIGLDLPKKQREEMGFMPRSEFLSEVWNTTLHNAKTMTGDILEGVEETEKVRNSLNNIYSDPRGNVKRYAFENYNAEVATEAWSRLLRKAAELKIDHSEVKTRDMISSAPEACAKMLKLANDIQIAMRDAKGTKAKTNISR